MTHTTNTPTLFLICGLPCAGKTTCAKELEKTHQALRLTPDEWMEKIVGDGYNEEKRAAVEAIMLSIAERCLSLGINVILDFGFWSRSERDSLRILAHKVGARVEVHFLDVPMEELLKRMHDRRATEPEFTFNFTEEDLKLWASWFEAPGPDELGPSSHGD